ncbi:MAG: ABC transporter permease [Acidobacteria bacterium]|nr:ABC transporter permease [Acidobacteriota bacterium]
MTTDPRTPGVEARGASRGAAPGLWTGAWRVFDLSVGHMLWSRRTIFMALVVGLPVVVSTVLRVLVALDVPVLRPPATGPVVFGMMFWGFFVRFAVPVLAVFYGTALIADEVEDKTITYLLTRPVRRASVLLGKYVAYLVSTVAVVLPAVVLMWLLIVPIHGSLATSFPDLAADLGILVVGLAAYGALFALVGATLRRPLVFGLLFVFGWETLTMALPGYLRQLTVAHYLQGLVPHAMPAESPLAILQMVFRDPPGIVQSLVGLAVVTGVGLVLAARAVARREYVLEH